MEELDARQKEVLRAIVQEHIATGEPVGSASIARRDVAVSPATVRSVMADLEALGLLEKPHTSAGRVPTERGYRYYVDALVQTRAPSAAERATLERAAPSGAVEEYLRSSLRLLSSISRYAAVVTMPGLTRTRWSRIEFVRLRENRVLAILVSPTGLVRNRLLSVEFPISDRELAQASAWLTEVLAESSLEEVRDRLLEEISRERVEYDALASKILALGRQLFVQPMASGGEVVIEGQHAFFEAPEFADVTRARKLFSALEEKSKLLAVLERTLSARELQIFIGAESEFSARTGASVVAAPYGTESAVVGSIGIIGPTRMDYSRALGLVDYTARLISRFLQES